MPSRAKPTLHAARKMRMKGDDLRAALPQAPVHKFIKTVMKGDGSRVSKKACGATRTLTEGYIAALCADAAEVAYSRKRMTITPEDIEAVISLRCSKYAAVQSRMTVRNAHTGGKLEPCNVAENKKRVKVTN